MVGGDNAARSVAIGLVLGAYHGIKAIPQDGTRGFGTSFASQLKELLSTLNARPKALT